jgi:pimeloyl-ACP methyl ester carboxylesterase
VEQYKTEVLKIDPIEQEGFYPVEDIYCRVNDLKIHYQVSGPLNAPPLVLVHGIGGNINWWRMNMPAFSPHFRTYALDLPGFGKSRRLRGDFTIPRAVEFIKVWLELLQLDKIKLLGHSMGGQISTRFAATYPEKIDKLVLVAPSGLWYPLFERLGWVRKTPLVNVPINQSLSIAIGTMRTDIVALALSLKAILSDRDTESSIRRVQAPTLVVWGIADGVLPHGLGQRFIDLLPDRNGQLVLIERGTHNFTQSPKVVQRKKGEEN